MVLQNHRAMEHGAGKAIGGSHGIISNDLICGLTTTHQFQVQQSSINSIADRLMPMQNGIDDETIGKQGHALPDTSFDTPGNSTHLLDLCITREGEASTSNRQANNIEAELIVARDIPLNLENVPDANWEDFQGDYLEMNDLVIPLSPSSSSGNSSCLTMSSDECFENEIIKDSEKKGADHTFDVASDEPDRIVTCALSPGSSTARVQEEIHTTWITSASSPNASAPTDKTAGQTLPKQEIIEELQNPDDIPSGRGLATSTSTSNAPASTGKNTVCREVE